MIKLFPLFLVGVIQLNAAEAWRFSGNFIAGGNFGAYGSNVTPPFKAINPIPANGATLQPNTLTLSWQTPGVVDDGFSVYYDGDNPPTTLVSSHQVGLTYATTDLYYGMTRYWRVDSHNSVGTTAGDVWSFSTVVPNIVDTLVDMEAGNDGETLTTTILTNATKGTSVEWSFPVTNISQVVLFEHAFITPIVYGTTTNIDAGSTRSFKFRLDTKGNYAAMTLGTPTNRLTVNFSFKFDNKVSQTVDLVNISTVAGSGACVAQLGSVNNLWIHDGGGGGFPSQHGTGPVIVTNTLYTCSMRAIHNGDYTLAIYNGTTGALIANSTVTTPTDATFNKIYFGRVDAHADPQPPSTSWITFEDISVDITNATWPIIP